MQTVKGIFYNLKESIYCYRINKLTFVFSSKFYLEKFKNLYPYYVEQERLKFEHKYNCKVTGDEIFLLSLYKQIEKRSFLVYNEKTEIQKDYTVKIKI